MIRLARQHDLARDRNALVVAGLLSTLLHLALLKWLVGYSQTPAINPPVPETEIVLASPSDIESDKPPAAKPAPPPSTPKSAPEIQARLPPTDGRRQRRGASRAATPGRNPELSSRRRNWPTRAIGRPPRSLKHLEPQTRSQQLCDFEAILQINRQFNEYAVDFVIAYATEAVVRKGDVVIAHGAAFHSNGRWYNLAFECQLSTSQRDVAHLKFKVGDAIPSEQWADLNLPRTPANPLGGD